jgi:hypothetical protein
VTRLGKAHNKERTCFFLKEFEDGSAFGGCSCGVPLKEFEDGSAFGGCSCGVPYTDGVPCHHMVAVVKSSGIEGLTPTNAMPYWWSTECQRKQVPFECNVTFDSGIETIPATTEDTTMKYTPPYAAARKAGRLKMDKQIKSPLKGGGKEKDN